VHCRYLSVVRSTVTSVVVLLRVLVFGEIGYSINSLSVMRCECVRVTVEVPVLT